MTNIGMKMCWWVCVRFACLRVRLFVWVCVCVSVFYNIAVKNWVRRKGLSRRRCELVTLDSIRDGETGEGGERRRGEERRKGEDRETGRRERWVKG